MAQVFQVNGTTITALVKADWGDEIIDDDLAGQSIRNRWKMHVLQTEAMTAAEYDTLYALQGQKVTLTTTNYRNRNGDYKTYYDAVFLGIEAGHMGPIRQNVRAMLAVRT